MPANAQQQTTTRAAAPDRLLGVLTSNTALVLGTVASLVSIAAAIRKTILYGLDFQWSDARLLLQHRDPWAVYLSGDVHHEILLNQVPNFLHELYVFLLPFGLLPFSEAKLIWASYNLLFVAVLVRCVTQLYELDNRQSRLLLLLVLTSTPFRVTVQNGQNDALALMCISLWALVRSESGRGLLLGLAYEKYSIPPVLALFLLLRKRGKLLAYSLLPPLAGFLLVDAWLPTPGRMLLFEPFRTALHGNNVSRGIANIMAVTEKLLEHLPHPAAWTALLPYLLGVALACGIAGYFASHAAELDGRILLACLMAASLACFKHQIYDFLALIFCLGAALKAAPGRARSVVLGVIAYFWFVERILHIWRWEFHLFTILPSFLLLLWMIAATTELGRVSSSNRRWRL
jgi:hypothetical protein